MVGIFSLFLQKKNERIKRMSVLMHCLSQVLSYRKQKVGVGRMSSVNSDASLVLSFTVFVQVKKEPVKLFFSHHTPQESEITHLMSP